MTSIPPPRPVTEPETVDAPQARPAEDQPDWRLWMAPAAIVLGLALGEVAVINVDVIGSAAGSSFAHPTPADRITRNVGVDLPVGAPALYFAAAPPPLL